MSSEDIRNGNLTFNHCFNTADIEKITFLQLSSGNNLYDRSEEIFRNLNTRPKKIIQLQQFVTAYNLAADGLGCTLASSRLIERHPFSNLMFYELPSSLLIRDFHFTTRKNAYVSKPMQRFC